MASTAADDFERMRQNGELIRDAAIEEVTSLVTALHDAERELEHLSGRVESLELELEQFRQRRIIRIVDGITKKLKK